MAGYPKRQNRKNSGDKEQGKIARDIDSLNDYDEFCNTVLPKLRKMIAENKNAGDMYKEFQSMVAARIITEALTTKDPKQALANAQEILNRGMGKPKETVDINTRYEKLSDEELDSLLESKEDENEELHNH